MTVHSFVRKQLRSKTSRPSLDCALFVEYAVSTPPRAVLFFQAFLRFFFLMWAI